MLSPQTKGNKNQTLRQKLFFCKISPYPFSFTFHLLFPSEQLSTKSIPSPKMALLDYYKIFIGHFLFFILQVRESFFFLSSPQIKIKKNKIIKINASLPLSPPFLFKFYHFSNQIIHPFVFHAFRLAITWFELIHTDQYPAQRESAVT